MFIFGIRFLRIRSIVKLFVIITFRRKRITINCKICFAKFNHFTLFFFIFNSWYKFNFYFDLPSIFGELKGIRKQIHQNLFHALFISFNIQIEILNNSFVDIILKFWTSKSRTTSKITFWIWWGIILILSHRKTNKFCWYCNLFTFCLILLNLNYFLNCTMNIKWLYAFYKFTSFKLCVT